MSSLEPAAAGLMLSGAALAGGGGPAPPRRATAPNQGPGGMPPRETRVQDAAGGRAGVRHPDRADQFAAEPYGGSNTIAENPFSGMEMTPLGGSWYIVDA